MKEVIVTDMLTCLICGQEFAKLGKHVEKSHALGLEEYLIRYRYGGNRPTCECGCGGRVSYGQGKFTRYVQGHWRPSVEQKKKMSEARRAYFVTNPERRRSVGETMRAFCEENPGIRAELSRKAHMEHPESYRKSEETRRKISESHRGRWNDVARASASELRRKFWRDNPEKLRASIAKTAAANVSNPDWRDRISAGVSEALRTKSFAWEMGRYTSTKTGRTCRYRSSWELIRMHMLDEDPEVLDWESEPFVVPYELNGRLHRYTPDLVIFHRSGVIVEEVGVPSVKDTPRNIAKRSALERLSAAEGWSVSWAWSPPDHIQNASDDGHGAPPQGVQMRSEGIQ